MLRGVRPAIDISLCIADQGCRECIIACPYDLLVLTSGGVGLSQGVPCEPFWACFHACPMAAITMQMEGEEAREV